MAMVARAEPGCPPVKLEVRCTPDMLDRLLLLVRMGLPEKNGSAASAADCLPAAGQLPTSDSFCASNCTQDIHRQHGNRVTEVLVLDLCWWDQLLQLLHIYPSSPNLAPQEGR